MGVCGGFFFSYSALGFSGLGEEEEGAAAEEASEEEAAAAAGEAETIEEAVAEAVAEVAEEVAEVAEVVAEAAQEVETAAEEVAAVAEAVEEAAQAVAEPPAPAVEEPENNGMTSPAEEEAAASEAWGSTHSPFTRYTLVLSLTYVNLRAAVTPSQHWEQKKANTTLSRIRRG